MDNRLSVVRGLGCALAGLAAAAGAPAQSVGPVAETFGLAETEAREPQPPVLALGRELAMPENGFVPAVGLGPVNMPALRLEDQARAQVDKVLRIGVGRDIDAARGVGGPGSWVDVPGGGRLWRLDVFSLGAIGLRVHLTGLNLPPGARVVVHSLRDPTQAAGPYEGRGLFGDGALWTTSLEGDQARIECYFPDLGPGQVAAVPGIDRVQHLYFDPFAAPEGGCHNDIVCYPTLAASGRAVGGIAVIGENSLFCTGQLLNAQNSDKTPYFLTANHCINTAQEAQTAEIFWRYQKTVCNGPVPSLFTGPRSAVCTLLATGAATDYTLLMVEGGLPADAFWLGWTTAPIADQTPVTGIHHPGGVDKKVSFGQKIAGTTCGGAGHVTVDWGDGPTEPGSSGSGIYRNDTKQLFGQLHCGASSCASLTTDDYGAFASSYQFISSLLQGGTDDGHEPNDTCATARALSPGTYGGRIVKSTDQDWYRIGVPPGQTLTVTASFTNANGNINLRLYGVCGGPALASSVTTNNSDTITFKNTGVSSVVYLVQVFLASDTRNQYSLTVGISVGPPNNICANATPIGNGLFSGTTLGASADGTASCGNSNATPDVWYRYTASCTGTAFAETCGSSFNTVLSVHTGCPGSAANQLAGACNNDAVGGACAGTTQSRLTFPVISGQQYLVRVSGVSGAKGAFQLRLGQAVPQNNLCANAISVTNGTRAIGNCNATTDGPNACDFGGYTQIGSDVWYKYVATCTGAVTVNLCGSAFDTKLAVYGAACPGASTAPIQCNDDSCDLDSRVTFSAFAGQTYRIRIGGFEGEQGSGTMTITCLGEGAGGGCLADCDADGALAPADLVCFQTRFTGGDPWADCNADGALTVSDFGCFQTRYARGCP